MDLLLTVFLTLILSFGQQTTESQALCEKDVMDKKQILTESMSQCRWEVPSENDVDNSRGCTSYETVDGESVLRTTARSGAGYSGRLVCGSTYQEQASSYVDNTPSFYFPCSHCSSSGNQNSQLDATCIEKMIEQEINDCRVGHPRMNFQYAPGQQPVRVEQ